MAGQALRYLVAGGVAVLTLYLVLTFLVEACEVESSVASALGFAAAVPVNYGLQRRFVFGSTARHTESFPYYVAVTAATLGLNTTLFWLFANPLAVPYLIAQALTLAVITPVNFVLNRTVTFSDRTAGQGAGQ